MTEQEVELLAGKAGLVIDPAFLAGVARNLEVLAAQTALLFEPPIDPLVEPASVFRA